MTIGDTKDSVAVNNTWNELSSRSVQVENLFKNYIQERQKLTNDLKDFYADVMFNGFRYEKGEWVLKVKQETVFP